MKLGIIAKALLEAFRVTLRDLSQSQNRRLADVTKDTQISETVIPLVKYNMDTHEVESWGTWTGDQTITGDLALTQGQKLYLDTDKDSYLWMKADDEYYFYSGGSNRLTVVNTNIGIHPLLICYSEVRIANQALRLDEKAADPAGVAGAGFIYTKDDGGTNRLHFLDDGGTVRELVATGLTATGDIAVTGDVTPGDDINMTNTGRINIDTDADTYLVCSADDVLELYVAGSLLCKFRIRASIPSIQLETQNRLYFDETKSTYIASTSTGNGFIFYADGTKIQEAYASGLFYKKNLAVQDPGYLLLQELAAGVPGGSAGYGKLCCVDNAGTTELWFVDDAGASTQLA